MTGTSAPHLRFDITTNDWVLFAPSRAARPHPVSDVLPRPERDDGCPFCPGREAETPDEIFRLTEGAGREGWSVRVVENKFPALDRSAVPGTREVAPAFRLMGGYGAHEVVIESPNHAHTLAREPVEHVERVLRTVHARFRALMDDGRLKAIVVFKNHGERAGTSLAHPHWQIIATPVVPHLLRLKHAIATEYFDRTGQCLYCVAREDELAAGERVVSATDDYVAVAPFASHVPFQVRILPREQQASFGDVPPTRLRALAGVLQGVLQRLDRALADPHYNLTIGTAPIGDERLPYFMWHIDVLPRLTTPAGFELGSGMAINPVLPEIAARILRGEGVES